MKNLTEQELKKVQEYSDWLKSGGDVLEFKQIISYFAHGKYKEDDSFVANIDKNRLIVTWGDGRTPLFGLKHELYGLPDKFYLDYFKPIAESLYRKWMFKKICGGIFEAS